MSHQQMESPIEAIVEYMKTFVEQLVANENSIDVMITECLQSMVASVDHKCHELSDESKDGIKSGDNLGVDDIDMSEDFWDELGDDFDINFSDNDMKSSPRELITTSDEKRLDFNQKFSLLLSELVAKPSTDTSRVDGTDLRNGSYMRRNFTFVEICAHYCYRRRQHLSSPEFG
jgi:hypothetical protein